MVTVGVCSFISGVIGVRMLWADYYKIQDWNIYNTLVCCATFFIRVYVLSWHEDYFDHNWHYNIYICGSYLLKYAGLFKALKSPNLWPQFGYLNGFFLSLTTEMWSLNRNLIWVTRMRLSSTMNWFSMHM